MKYQELELVRKRLYCETRYSADSVQETLAGRFRASELRLMEEEDAIARRQILDLFGKFVVYELEAPASWWQHVKHALRLRWPRLFKRLKVRYVSMHIDTGAVYTEQVPLGARKFFLPYVAEYKETRTK